MRLQMELEWVLGSNERMRVNNKGESKVENNKKYYETSNIFFLKIYVYEWWKRSNKLSCR